jgi:rare lipoprotein A
VLVAGCTCGGGESSAQGASSASTQSESAAAASGSHRLQGEATWYGRRHHGRTTASGEPFDMYDFTAAHRTLPFGTVVRVVRDDTRQSVVVRINDRGPYGEGRIIDLSRAAAEEIELIGPGHLPVTLEILELPEP